MHSRLIQRSAEARANLVMRISLVAASCLWLTLAYWRHSWLLGIAALALGPLTGFLLGERLVARLGSRRH
jgi:hypothetical protein